MSKVMVSIPDDLLQRLDHEARKRSLTRSALLAAAVRRELERPGSDEVSAAIARSEARFQRSPAFDAARIVRADRDTRR